MGITERKQRDKVELKGRILSAARQLFLEKGFDKTSMRNIADLIEYSPGIIYHYFKDKNEIFHTLHAEGFLELGRRMQVLLSVNNPMERLKAMGKIYIEYGIENPDMYDLMFIKEAPVDFLEDESHWKEGSDVFGGLRNTVEQCVQAGHFKGHETEALSFMVWSTVHGMVSLQIRKRCDVINSELKETIVSDAYQSLTKIIDKL
jgi:AcrR family transcriptional regulator